MKEMIYQSERKIDVLDTGYCFGLLYYILSLGTHPTAYVKIPMDHKYYEKDYDEIDINVYGGLTYSQNNLYINKNQNIQGWFIGWDYAHYGDYMGNEERLPKELRTNGKKWTIEEIRKDVFDVCYQLKKGE